jgi:DNA-binding NtrC family response regulator
MANHSPVRGKSILIVEDEFIIGMMLCQELARAGAIPFGPLSSVADAVKKIDGQVVDLVILDAKLAGGSGADLVASLKARGIPYVVVSGYEKASLPAGLRGVPFVAKPVSMPLLMEAIEAVTAARGPALRPAPERPRTTDPAD